MDLIYIDKRLKEIREMTERIIRELNLEIVDQIKNPQTNKFSRKFDKIKDIKMACIMDEFTYQSFSPECRLLQISPDNWKVEMENFKPDIFFIESAWRGKDDLWKSKVAHLSDELIEAVGYCRSNNIPVVFWNKEDPVHFDTFLGTAKLADFVFTTDIDCVHKYKSFLKHDHVFVMPFAAQTKIHNPIEIEDRKDRFCFAGAYYARYPDRARDLETFVDTTVKIKGLDIYDRNYYNNDPNYSFPKKYKKYIVGTLKPDEIDKAYKGYRFNINMNSVKQSQSMCARRVFELLASNTVTVSNYSRAIRNLLGDLVVTTDDAQRLEREILKFNDQIYYNKFRLLGLRKVLSEHTYRHRMQYLVQKVFGEIIESQSLSLLVIAKPENEEDLNRIIGQFNRQAYGNKRLLIIQQNNLKLQDYPSERVDFIEKLSEQELNKHDCVAFFSNHDYYGKNYLTDLVFGIEYSEKAMASKSAYYICDQQNVVKVVDSPEYRFINQAKVRKSLFNIRRSNINELIDASLNIDEALIKSEGISIDEFNYCMNYEENECELVEDLNLADTGIAMSEIYKMVDEFESNYNLNQFISISHEEIRAKISDRPQVKIDKENNFSLYIDSKLSSGHDYVYLNQLYQIDKLNVSIQNTLDFYLDAEFIDKFSFELAVVFFDSANEKIDSEVKPVNRKITVNVDPRAKYIKLGFRLAGVGKCIVKELLIGQIDMSNGVYLNKSKTLLITNHYPDYDDLYRYAFIHTRLTEYKNHGIVVDVFKCNNRYPKGYSEFNGIDIITGYHDTLDSTPNISNYETILIHFLNEELWNGLKNHIVGKRVIIWVHGAEIQPWWRRKFNFTSPEQLDAAKRQSESRMAFWKEIFGYAMNGVYDLHFVFVSQYFANEVFEDMKISLPTEKYSVIHNYINGNLFKYNKKEENHRKKILAIRPFASQKYANDLMINAILELAKQPFFNELEFRIIGKGDLYQKTVKPVKKYRNVILEEKFLRQEEIAELHAEYGVFLTPTRCDSQGVSRDEAMSSGLVPVTNNVSAIPEFVDESCGMLAGEEDYKGLADSIVQLYRNPKLFLRLSEAAAIRVREQSGIYNTIMKEINLINGNE